MLLYLIATLCGAGTCMDRVVTDQATQLECAGPTAAQRIPQWMTDNGYLQRGYRLAGYRCERAKRTPV